MVNRVAGIGTAPVSPSRSKPASAATDQFSVTSEHPEAVQENLPAQTVSLVAMLALQEAETGAVQNKAGRRRGFALLDALSALQKNLLSPLTDTETALASLMQLAAETPPTTDPGLAELLAAIRLRAKIELLRRGIEIN